MVELCCGWVGEAEAGSARRAGKADLARFLRSLPAAAELVRLAAPKFDPMFFLFFVFPSLLSLD